MNNKKKLATLTKFIVFSVSVVLIYTICEFIYSIRTGISHDTLSTCVYAFFGTELASCTLIKVFNILKIKGDN